DRQQINDAVSAAERQTSAQIMPVVATVSGRYDRAEDVVGLWVGILLAAVSWTLIPERSDELGAFGGVPAELKLLLIMALVGVGFVIGAWLAGRIVSVRRLFTPLSHMHEQVDTAARRVFFDQRMSHTERGTGLLMYISLYEQLAVVLADRGSADRLGPETLEHLCNRLTWELKNGDVTAALSAVIAETGATLSRHLPAEPGQVNELPDALITLD
ncbi:MAG: hypothetical protein OER86_05650, partial [Phycisphaerae bacterium]|nr:hypothetical protein [Phycisphaerae bacterium]